FHLTHRYSGNMHACATVPDNRAYINLRWQADRVFLPSACEIFPARDKRRQAAPPRADGMLAVFDPRRPRLAMGRAFELGSEFASFRARGGSMTLATVMSVEDTLRQEVVSELAADPGVGGIEIGVAVEDGLVTLTGYVSSLRERIAAERAVKRVEGVRCV